MYAFPSNDSVRRAQGRVEGEVTCQEHPDSDGGKNLTTGGAGRARVGDPRKRVTEVGQFSLVAVDRWDHRQCRSSGDSSAIGLESVRFRPDEEKG